MMVIPLDFRCLDIELFNSIPEIGPFTVYPYTKRQKKRQLFYLWKYSMMTWYIILFLGFAALGIFLGILFFLKERGGRFSNTILGTFCLLFSLELIYQCLKWSGQLYTLEYIHLSFLHMPLWLTYGPLIFIYLRSVTTGKGFVKKDVLFLVPILWLVFLLYPYYLLPSLKKMEVVQMGQFYEVTHMTKNFIWVIIGFMGFYGGLMYHQSKTKRKLGFIENRWSSYFIASYFGYVFLYAAYIVLVETGIMSPNYDYFIDIAIVAFIGLLAFFGFVQPEVFEGKPIKAFIPFVKYRKTGLSEALSHEMKQKLLYIMETEKPYLNNSLRLDDLSQKLNLSRNHTSQIINQNFNLTFFDFINKYRVECAKQELLCTRASKTNIQQIAYEVGFNTRASFYKAFKKFEGQNPSEFLRHQRQVG